MNQTIRKIETILTSQYDVSNYTDFIREIFPAVQIVAPDRFHKEYTNFSSHIEGYAHVGNYTDPDGKTMIIFAVQLKKESYVENSRSTQRSYAKKLMEAGNADAAIVAFYTEGDPKWRLSFVRLDYEIKFENGKLNTTENMTPAKRYSYLVGQDEPCHTAITRFRRFIVDDPNAAQPTLDDLEEAFSVEKVTEEFFNLYCEKFHQLRESLEANPDFIIEAEQHNFTSAQFAKKLMGQIVFLYFLQKKGWLGVSAWPKEMNAKEYKNAFYARGAKSRELIPRVYVQVAEDKYKLSGRALDELSDADETVLASCVKGNAWGTGSKTFMRTLFDFSQRKQANFFDDFLEPLFYNALNVNRGEQGYAPALHCRIPFLSGGLFEPIDGYDWEHNDFAIPNSVFSNKDEKGDRDADGILDIFDRYNFTMSEDEPLEREVAIDPEMLGKVFENLLEVKDRKSKGAFYTPREIVHYMCQESLISYLIKETGLKEQDIRDFILLGDFMKDKDTAKNRRQGEHDMLISEEIYKIDQNGNVVVDRLKDIDNALANIRVADPAVGSGAFPLGMLNEIVRARQNISAYMAITMNAYQTRNMYNNERSPYSLKLQTIKNCIFAADIEPSAVDITQLRLWLSLVIDDEINPEANSPLDGHKNPIPLPNLECNIVCGNSLVDEFEGIKLINFSDAIGTSKSSEQQNMFQNAFDAILPSLIEAQDALFHCDNTVKKQELKDRIEALKDEIIKSQMQVATAEVVERYKEANREASKPFVLWQLDFARIFREKGGFDVVIGNPPYIKIQNIDNNQAELLKKKYITATGKFDIYVLFIEKAFNLLSEDGMCAFIQPHRFLNVGYGKGLRTYLQKNKALNKLVHFGVDQIFDSATTYTGVFFYKTNSPSILYATAKDKNLNTLQFSEKAWDELGKTWSFSEKETNTVVKKITSNNTKLLDVFAGIYQGLITLGDDIFMFEGYVKDGAFYGYSKEAKQDIEIEADVVKPLLKGENIRRYSQPQNALYVLYPHKINSKGKTVPLEEDEFKEKYPKAYNYILQFKDYLESKKVKYKTNPKYWYSLHRAREIRIFESEKIITPQLQNYGNFAIDRKKMYPDAGGYMLIIKDEYASDLYYYYGILNSSLFYHFITSTSAAFSNNYYYFKKAYIEPFHFPDSASEGIKQSIIDNVTSILNSRAENEEIDVSEYERNIDLLVYKLYGVTPDEQATIEEKYNVR